MGPDSGGMKVRFIIGYSHTSKHPYPETRTNESLGDLLCTRKSKCLFWADAVHGQVCSPFCNTGVSHAEEDYHNSIDLHGIKEVGIGIFANE